VKGKNCRYCGGLHVDLVRHEENCLLNDDTELTASRFVFPIGRLVSYQPIKGLKEYQDTAVRSKPWRLGSGQIVVMVEGRSGGVSIDHLQLR